MNRIDSPRIYADSRAIEQDFGMGRDQVGRYRTMGDTVQRRRFLSSSTGRNERIAHVQDLNYVETRKKESLAAKVVKAPFRAAGKVANETIVKRPILTIAGTAALLYFTGAGASLMSKLQGWIAKAPDRKAANIVKNVVPSVAPKGGIGVTPGSPMVPNIVPPGTSPGPAGPIL